jgi:uncharacterized protein (TIGR03089 family)
VATEHALGGAVARVATVSTRPLGPPELLRRLVASDPGRPRITVYDDTESATRGERVELSARVLANWVAKAANLLQDDLDLGPGTLVVLDLPPHWRTLYWALAVWSVGGCVEVPQRRTGDAAGVPTGPDDAEDVVARGADLVVTDAVDVASGADEAVLVTLAALARSASGPVPPRAVDEARELATHGDVFGAWDEPAPDDAALRSAAGTTTYDTLVPVGSGVPERVHTVTADTVEFLRHALEAWAGDGSLVLTRGRPADDVLRARLESEGVTATR